MLQIVNIMDGFIFKRFHFFIIFIIFSLNLDNVVHTDDAEKATTTTTTTAEPLEPEGQIGCPPPDFKITRMRKTYFTTEPPFVTFETTQIYLPQDFTTADLEFVENVNGNVNIDGNHESGTLLQIRHHSSFNSEEQVAKHRDDDDSARLVDDMNPYWWEVGLQNSEGNVKATLQHSKSVGSKKRRRNLNRHKRMRKHHHRQRQYHHHDHHKLAKRALLQSSSYNLDDDIIDNSFYSNTDDLFYVETSDVMGNLLNENDSKPFDNNNNDNLIEYIPAQDLINETITLDAIRKYINYSLEIGNGQQQTSEVIDNEKTDSNSNNDMGDENGTTADALHRVKRKSGKATGALSRAKAGSDSSSSKKSGHRHKQGEGQFDEETGNPMLIDSEEIDEKSSEEEEDAIITQFREVSEVRFPGEVGPLGDHRLCKIKCVDGKWIGPLCAMNEQEDENGQIKFEPLYKRCIVDQIPPHLQLSYKNVTVTVGWDLPHGHTLQARCKDLGLFKLLGEAKVLCSNGLWAPRMPQCVPTTILTNYSDDSPPSIRIKVGVGSAAYEPSGMLAVLPGSTLHLDCMYPRKRGSPEWTWTGWFRQYLTGWSAVPEEKASRYRLTIKDIQNPDTGTYTCASPRGLTNSIAIVVAVSQCNNIFEPNAPLQLRLEGNKLGQRAVYRCPLGFNLQGSANATCLASGNWSSPPPTCQSIQCPPLFLEDPHLSLVELNTSAWGRAVFRCAWGYRLSGPPSLECEPDGRWSTPIPRCRAIQCPQPLIPINGRIDGTSGIPVYGQRRYAVGALVTFSCTDGHSLVGEASIVCTETGFWSHPPPFCKAQCPYPGDPPNGLIAPLKFYYDPGDYLSVQCRPGFVEHGGIGGVPDRPKCMPDGNWSSAVPQCKNYEEI